MNIFNQTFSLSSNQIPSLRWPPWSQRPNAILFPIHIYEDILAWNEGFWLIRAKGNEKTDECEIFSLVGVEDV
jgi:hypothetical protein